MSEFAWNLHAATTQLFRQRVCGKSAAAVVVSCIAASAFARPPQTINTGTNTTRATSSMVASMEGNGLEIQPTDRAVAVARETLRCAVTRSPERARAVLGAGDQASFRASFARLSDTVEDCFDVPGGSELGLQPLSLAGLLAEAWFSQTGAPALPRISYDQNEPKLDFISNGPSTLVQVRLAECLASRNPDAVKGFVAAKPASTDEDVTFGAIIPLIPTCLDRNVTLRANRTALRLALAYAFYRRTLPTPRTGAEAK